MSEVRNVIRIEHSLIGGIRRSEDLGLRNLGRNGRTEQNENDLLHVILQAYYLSFPAIQDNPIPLKGSQYVRHDPPFSNLAVL